MGALTITWIKRIKLQIIYYGLILREWGRGHLHQFSHTIFIVDPCIGTQVSSKRRDGQFGTHLDPQGPSGLHGYFWQQ